MKKIVLMSACVIGIGIYSCKKDPKKIIHEDSVNEAAKTYPNYANLKAGNYWIYERFEIDPSGNATSIHIIDSCYVEKDTLINGYLSYKYSLPGGYPNIGTNQSPNVFVYLRDSLSYLIDAKHGDILFSSEDFTTLFVTSTYVQPPNDTVYVYQQKMGDKDVNITTPAGTFITSSMKGIYKMYPNYNPCANNLRTIDTRYAQNVGKISEGFQFFAGNCNHWERRLIRYHFN
jgi:hypothetical protein